MNEIGMTELLSRLRELSQQAQARAPSAAQPSPSDGFQQMLNKSIGQVNGAQQQAESLAKAFEAGDPNTDLAAVMVAMQKASVSFQAMTQVRNKLVSAYQEIMSMQV
jgi:flagellar hook-basal body complex protein FliE